MNGEPVNMKGFDEKYAAHKASILTKGVNKIEQLPIGTRIIFTRELSDGPDEFSPGNLYAEKGDGGEITGHGCREGYWVKWDKWMHPFGAELGKDFKVDKQEGK